MKKSNFLVGVLILCVMFFAACGSSSKRSQQPINRAALPGMDRSWERNDYKLLNNVKVSVAVAEVSTKGGKEIKAEGGEFTNICIVNKKTGLTTYDMGSSKGSWYVGDIAELQIGGNPNPCSATSMASAMAAYRLINEVQTAGADGIVQPLLRTSQQEIEGGILYTIEISAKMIQLKTED